MKVTLLRRWSVAGATLALAAAACRPDAEPTKEPPPAPEPAVAVYPALATPDAGSAWIHVVIGDRPGTCADPLGSWPSSCEPRWRIRVDLPPDAQIPGDYPLAEGSRVFAFRDAQGPAAGAWVRGTRCANLGKSVRGSLRLATITRAGVSGTLHGADGDIVFAATRCPACSGTGMRCRADADCCTRSCSSGTCRP